MVISTLKGERVIYQPKTGGLHGDCIMPEMFAALYDPVIDDWMSQKGHQLQCTLTATDPNTGREVDVSVTLYADDVNERNLTRDEEHRQEVLQVSTQLFDQQLERLSMAQNLSKAEHMPTFLSKGCVKETKKAARRMVWDAQVLDET